MEHSAGTVLELVSHVFGASQRPTGTRGLFAQWRFASKVIDVDALGGWSVPTTA